jgi:hypothetical protein
MAWAWENSGAGRWSDAGLIRTIRSPVVSADLTGDGRADLLSTAWAGDGRSWRMEVARAC